MITIEMLNQNPVVSGLTEAQKAVIAEMSRNDENTVIGTKIGALHGQYDADILSITGIVKNAGEKSYDYAKRVLNEYKGQLGSVTELQGKLTKAEKEVADLQAKIQKGEGDEALRQQLKDTKAQVTQLQAQLQAKETEFTTEKAKFESDLKAVHVDYAFNAATSGLKFKAGITEPVQKALINVAKNEVLAKGTPDFVDDGQGGQRLVLRDNNGIILNNPKNNLNPYTLSELIVETSLKDVLDTGRQQTGGGTTGNLGGAGGGDGTILDLSSAKSQVEADKIITNHLLANGLTRDSSEFAEQSMQLRNENNVGNLPLR